eukprot:CAMPEP_0113288712 /NCGR_PEP_ID=MMETSP0008_2-20120614/32460_1 /TAXON_ID=97485 /ORGANISM="Prymnesium parvum" /LENGTH=43 /DNA_ID=CAMNT_0000140173 /DNA_START=124 /DNA_END=256 /DNA_ORIENTATION=- /assembly_acc=CAM_ASM_000153
MSSSLPGVTGTVNATASAGMSTFLHGAKAVHARMAHPSTAKCL